MNSAHIECCFNACFSEEYQILMAGGGKEPIYIPGTPTGKARLVYREDYASSALHEAAHWCIAGLYRRRQIDFGYAYSPPPRTYREQQQFFKLEERVQALEWIFSDAARIDFYPSADNLEVRIAHFQKRLAQAKDEIITWIDNIADERPRAFRNCLSEGAEDVLPSSHLVSKRYG